MQRKTDLVVHYLLVTNDPDDLWIDVLRQAIDRHGDLKVVESAALDESVDLTQHDVIVLDAATIGNLSELLRQIRQTSAHTQVVVATNFQTWVWAREAFRLGAYDYLYKTLIGRDLSKELDDLQHRSER